MWLTLFCLQIDVVFIENKFIINKKAPLLAAGGLCALYFNQLKIWQRLPLRNFSTSCNGYGKL
jgi:hypothetical protein